VNIANVRKALTKARKSFRQAVGSIVSENEIANAPIIDPGASRGRRETRGRAFCPMTVMTLLGPYSTMSRALATARTLPVPLELSR